MRIEQSRSGHLLSGLHRLVAVVAALTVAFVVMPVGPAAAYRKKVTTAAPATVVEGDYFTVTARIASPAKARRVELQYLYQPYSWVTPTWKKLRSAKVKKRKSVGLSALAEDSSSIQVRTVVTYAGTRKKAVSRPVVIDIWHWIPISQFASYEHSGSVQDSYFSTFAMNGATWKGWKAAGAGESRYTLGRNCSRVKAQLGLSDKSAGGATGVISLATISPDNTKTPIYASPALTLGTTVSMDLQLDLPYRLSIEGKNTTPLVDGTQPAADVIAGDLQLLCHLPEP